MKNFAILIHNYFVERSSIYELLYKIQSDYRINCYCLPEQQKYYPDKICTQVLDLDMKPEIDCILVFGGDGTILRAKHIAISTSAPILGINLGYLGFLSESTLNDFNRSLESIINQKFKILPRMLIKCLVKRNGKYIYQDLALNDAVIYKAETPRLITVRIYNQNRFVLSTRCDGVVASTPTGSTAYSLSAGGPILAPQMQAVIISPLCPHLLSIRPMVFGAEEKITLRITQLEEPAWLQIDGVNAFQIEEQDEVIITSARESVSFIKLSNRTFYKILRNKLHLGK